MDCIDAGAERMRCSTISESAVYWLSMRPENMPAPLVRKAGRPTLSAGLSSRLRRRSLSTHTMVSAAPAMSIGSATGEPWKFAPVSVRLDSGKKIGLSPTPFSSISTCTRA